MTDLFSELAIDDWGRPIASYEQAIEFMFRDDALPVLEFQDSEELRTYNEMCRRFDKNEHVIEPTVPMPQSPEDFHSEKAREWLTVYREDTLWDDLFAKCRDATERERFHEELVEFSNRGMLPMLEQLNGTIRKLDEHGVVRGVGRGSSVASFILYLMGVHFVNPLDYDLPLSDFLK